MISPPLTSSPKNALSIGSLEREIALRRPASGQTLTAHWTAPDHAPPRLPTLASDRPTLTTVTHLTPVRAHHHQPDGQPEIVTPVLVLSGAGEERLVLPPEVSVLAEQACTAWLSRDVGRLDVLLGFAHGVHHWSAAGTRFSPSPTTDAVLGHCNLRTAAHAFSFLPAWDETRVGLLVRDIVGTLTHTVPSEHWILPWPLLRTLHRALHAVNREYLHAAVPEFRTFRNTP